MIWNTITVNIDHQSGEVLLTTSGMIKLDKLTIIETKYHDYNQATRTIIRQWRSNPQKTLEFPTELDEYEDERP